MDGFGTRLKQARGNLSQAAFAKQLGISQVAYSRYELDQREPCLDMLYQIGLITGVSADWLLGLPRSTAPSTSIYDSPGAIVASHGAKVNGHGAVVNSPGAVVNSHGAIHADCANCKFKRLAEALKAVQAG